MATRTEVRLNQDHNINLSQFIGFACSPELEEEIISSAERLDVSRSELIRRFLRWGLGMERAPVALKNRHHPGGKIGEEKMAHYGGEESPDVLDLDVAVETPTVTLDSDDTK